MNPCRLKQVFKAQFGTTIYALFQRERMARARELLRQHNVTETAGLLGYSNISHFSAAFHRQFGTLPGQVRRVTPTAPPPPPPPRLYPDCAD